MSANLTQDDARERARLLRVESYDVFLDVDSGDETFGCETTIRFSCSEPGSSTFVDVDAAEFSEVVFNGGQVEPPAAGETRLILTGLHGVNELRIKARFNYSHTGYGFHRFVDPVDQQVYLHTDFEPMYANRVYPCFDQPDLKATFDFTVKAPAGFEVVSTGAAASRPAAGEAGTWKFATTPRMPTYISVVVAGPFHVVRDRHREIDLGLYCRQSLAQYFEPEEIFELTKQGFDFFEEAFGYPYAFGKYDQLFVPEFNAGAMENAAAVTFNETYIYRSKVTDTSRNGRAETILHEMAHMWFGDLVTMRWWDDLWLNESFATYVSAVALVKATRFTNSWTFFMSRWKNAAYAADQLPTTHPIAAEAADAAAAEANFDAISYAKGASVLKQLVAWVGDKPFYEGIKNYFHRYEFANAQLSEFLAALEEGSGRDLESWCNDWLQKAGVNTIRASFETSGPSISSLKMIQEAPDEWPTLRSHRLALGLYDMDGDILRRRKSIEIDVVGASTAVPELRGERVPDLLLINDEDLTFSKIRLDPRSVATLTENLSKLEDSLARSLCWSATWDMVRDAELATRDYLKLVLNNVGGEPDVGVVQTLLGQVRTAIFTYGDPANRSSALTTLAAAARKAAFEAEPASDLQLTWAGNFIGAARSEEDMTFLRGLLDGAEEIDGLAVDIGIRWSIVDALVSRGVAGEELIEAELARDATDAGRRHALSAKARIPTAEAKAKAWKTITTDESLPRADLGAIIGGFGSFERSDLIEPYASSYFDFIKPMCDSRPREISRMFVSGMFPRTLIGEETLEMTDRYIAENDPEPTVKRTLLEARDGIQRAVRARAKDASS